MQNIKIRLQIKTEHFKEVFHALFTAGKLALTTLPSAKTRLF